MMPDTMSDDERVYLEGRCDRHRRMAERSSGQTARILHERFASLYADRARGRVVQD